MGQQPWPVSRYSGDQDILYINFDTYYTVSQYDCAPALLAAPLRPWLRPWLRTWLRPSVPLTFLYLSEVCFDLFDFACNDTNPNTNVCPMFFLFDTLHRA